MNILKLETEISKIVHSQNFDKEYKIIAVSAEKPKRVSVSSGLDEYEYAQYQVGDFLLPPSQGMSCVLDEQILPKYILDE